MPRIVGIDIPKNKRIEIALTYICGVGRFTAKKILDACNISGDVRAKDLTEEEVGRLISYLRDGDIKTEGDIRREVSQNIKRLMSIGSYRGTRHIKRLPCRGQKSKTNARTVKGPKRTIAGKKKAPAK